MARPRLVVGLFTFFIDAFVGSRFLSAFSGIRLGDGDVGDNFAFHRYSLHSTFPTDDMLPVLLATTLAPFVANLSYGEMKTKQLGSVSQSPYRSS